MSENGRLVALVVALAGSLKGVSEVIRAVRTRSARSGIAHETAQELAEALEKAEKDLVERTRELAECVGASVSL